MALNDIVISQLPVLDEVDLTDETIFVVIKDGLNYQVDMGSIKKQSIDNLYETRPLGEMSLIAPSPSQVFDDTAFTIITAFDKVQFERGVGIDLEADSVTILEDGNYQLSVTIVAEFDKAHSLDAAIMVDGAVEESFGNIQGLGAGKGVLIAGADIDPMTAGQVIQVAARRGEVGSTDVIFSKVRLIVARV